MSKSEKKGRAAAERFSSPRIAQFEPTDLQCIGLLAGLVFVFFFKILTDQAYFWEDFLYQNYPFRNFAATSMAMGQMPLWNPYTFNGMPFLADIQTTVLYLPCLILALFVSHGSLSYYWLELVIILHFFLAGTGMFYLAKSFELRNIPSLFAGAAYMLSGYMIVHAIHQQNVTLVAWYPLIFLLFRKALDQESWLYVFICGLVLGHSILAGYPQLSLYAYMFLGLYFLFEVVTQFRGKELFSRPVAIMAAKAGGIVVISIGLAMIQLLPTFELSGLSQRAQISFEKASEGSLAYSQLATFLFPKMFGSSGAGGYEYFGPGQYYYYWETCVYLGVLPLLLTIISAGQIRKNRFSAFLWGIVIFSVLFALGNNFVLFKFFFDFVPGFSSFRIPARMGILLTFSAALLSAFALQHMLYDVKSAPERAATRTILVIAGILGAVLYFMAVSGSFASSLTHVTPDQVAPLISKGVNPSMIIFVISGILLYAIIMKANLTRFYGLLLVIVLFIDMFVFGGSQNTSDTNPSEYFKRRSDLVGFFKKEGEKELFRVNTRNAQGILPGWDRNQGMIDRIFMMEGYTPLALQRAYAPVGSADKSFDLLNVKYKTVTDPKTGTLSLAEHPTRLPRAFFLYDLHVVKNEEELLQYIKSPDFNHRATAVLEKDPGRAIAAPTQPPVWKADITSYSNNRITVDASTDHDGLLVLSEIYYPGWKAYVDGSEKEIFRTDYNLRGVFVDAGRHRVEISFEPETFSKGAWVSIAVLAVCIPGITLSMVRSRRLRAAGQDKSGA